MNWNMTTGVRFMGFMPTWAALYWTGLVSRHRFQSMASNYPSSYANAMFNIQGLGNRIYQLGTNKMGLHAVPHCARPCGRRSIVGASGAGLAFTTLELMALSFILIFLITSFCWYHKLSGITTGVTLLLETHIDRVLVVVRQQSLCVCEVLLNMTGTGCSVTKRRMALHTI